MMDLTKKKYEANVIADQVSIDIILFLHFGSTCPEEKGPTYWSESNIVLFFWNVNKTKLKDVNKFLF